MAKPIKALVAVCAVMLFSTPAFSQLLISQYYEGTSFNKWIEITNPGPGPVNLGSGDWTLTLWTNANAEGYKTGGTADQTMFLTALGNIGAGGVVLVSRDNSVVPAYASADLTDNATINFNGNDSVVLYHAGVIVDAIGFTAANEGADTSFVRTLALPGWNTTAGSNATDFPSVWTEFTVAAVDGAVSGAEEYLGTSTVPVELQAFTID